MEICNDFVEKILFTGLMKKKKSDSSGNINREHIHYTYNTQTHTLRCMLIKREKNRIKINGENNLKRN